MWRVMMLLMTSVCIMGCAVGPVRRQDVSGQRTRNAVMPGITMIDDEGTWTFDTSNIGSAEIVDGDGTQGITIGVGMRRFVWQSGVPEIGNVVLSSTDDFGAEEVTLVTADGASVTVRNFYTGVSEPTRAANEALDRYREIWDSLTEDQRGAIEFVVEQVSDAIVQISPDAADIVRRLLIPAP